MADDLTSVSIRGVALDHRSSPRFGRASWRLRRKVLALTWFFALVTARSRDAHALDKQGAAHAGAGGADEKDAKDAFHVSGSLILGAALYNPTYAGRPDNTGLALLRYAAHVDIDLIGQKLSIPLDLNFFTDRTRRGALVFSPSEGDIIGGLTSTWPALKGSIELGLRVEHDRPLDRAGFSQSYVDLRGRYLYSLAAHAPKVRDALWDGDVTGWVTLGTFLYNPTYAARPDNTGLALFRYALHSEVSLSKNRISFGVDTTFFTPREKSVIPSELDLTVEVIGHLALFDMHLAYERDMPIDRGGLVQHFVYVLAGYNFDFKRPAKEPFSHKNMVPSP